MKNGEMFFVAVPLKKGDDIYAFRPRLGSYAPVAARKIYEDEPGGWRHEVLRPGDESEELIGIATQDIKAVHRFVVEDGALMCGGKIVGIVSHYPDYLPDGPEINHDRRNGGYI